ncbi:MULTISPECIES: hydrogenase maturation nickel metallochaperone HypA [Gemmobacter]|jgi:hydrogenase nickel incorporation protein HypA/HybF|uniref:Hydrogenase maturation factor HypA n=2 Tax=Gemmobacter TaxID=204456 RepID=A0A2T6AYZ6_9RHOB|nr:MULTISPECIES: hydrogenase maturation nickel metallochaperone HypA [Gemmobacter]OJY35226.1 MAG: hydrogenase maturation nickel metallochaperone HypA [Rhodobacterales bacterium 65-51]PTX49028.1 hydrogenase-3 nickel incorporation protein HypA [Gemmobacter caeni]TWI98971.1 hydrogenase nickel incorporation protein HypA/HybF [Gemmobacter caeni]
MHEMSLVEGIRSIVEDQARAHGFSRVTLLRLEIGRFAGVEKPALAFAFDVVMKGSPAEGARLEIIDLPGQALCYDCMKLVEIADRLAPCPLCDGGRLIPEGGDEMRIRNMEVL